MKKECTHRTASVKLNFKYYVLFNPHYNLIEVGIIIPIYKDTVTETDSLSFF